MWRFQKLNKNINQKLLVFKSTMLMKMEIKLKTIKERRKSHHILRDHLVDVPNMDVAIKLAYHIIINEKHIKILYKLAR